MSAFEVHEKQSNQQSFCCRDNQGDDGVEGTEFDVCGLVGDERT